LNLLERGIKPSDILSMEAFENAITTVIALEGSTNAVLHLLAIAHSAGIPLTIDDFSRIGQRVPVLADMRPAGQYAMSELIAIGGIQPLMKTLLDEGLLHGGCLTVTGRTLAENLADVQPYPAEQKVIRPLSNPVKKDSHLVILYGNLAPAGAVAKITGHEGLTFTGRARCFHGEEAAMQAILDGEVVKGDVVVVRYVGPKGGPVMREMLSVTSAINGRGLSQDVALITDGRFSGGSHGFVIGHITPEAFEGGPIALIEDGDRITVDAELRQITLQVADDVLAQRRAGWHAPARYATRGTLAKFARLVSSASEGAVTDKYLD
jgi:dihydroxy-acid dehydratase